MARVVGIGGVFFRARDPDNLRRWYADKLGVELAEEGHALFEGGHTVWSLFSEDTEYFGPSEQQGMVNYRVDDLDGMIAQLAAAGIPLVKGPDVEDNGSFAWIMDPDGNKVELWQPKKKA